MNRNQKVSSQFGWAPPLTKKMEDRSLDAQAVIRDVVEKTVRDMATDVAGHNNLAANANQIRVVSPSDAAPSQARKFLQRNRNVETGAQTILDMGSGSFEKMGDAEKVEARSQCARHCQRQGRTACKVCKGAGWESVAKTAPSRNRSRDVVSESLAFGGNA